MITRLLAPGWGGWGGWGEGPSSDHLLGRVFFPRNGISHQTSASGDGVAVLGVIDCRPAEPQIDADALTDARVRPPRLATTHSFIDKLKILPQTT